MTSQVLGLGLSLVGHGLGLGLVGHVLDSITVENSKIMNGVITSTALCHCQRAIKINTNRIWCIIALRA